MTTIQYPWSASRLRTLGFSPKVLNSYCERQAISRGMTVREVRQVLFDFADYWRSIGESARTMGCTFDYVWPWHYQRERDLKAGRRKKRFDPFRRAA